MDIITLFIAARKLCFQFDAFEGCMCVCLYKILESEVLEI